MKTKERTKELTRYKTKQFVMPSDGAPYIKKCSYCRLLKEASANFDKSDYEKDGYKHACKTCNKITHKAHGIKTRKRFQVKGCNDVEIAFKHPDQLPIPNTLVLVETIDAIMKAVILKEKEIIFSYDYVLSIRFYNTNEGILIHPSGALIIERIEDNSKDYVFYAVQSPAYLAPCIIATLYYLKDSNPHDCIKILTAIEKVKTRFTNTQLAEVKTLQSLIFSTKH